MSSTTAVQLTDLPAIGASTSRAAASPSGVSQRRRGRSPDDVLQASRDADSAVPDGGYGWVIVTSGAVLLWWSVGLTYSWGVMQAALVEDGLASPAVLSFVGSLQAALVSVLAIVSSRLMRWLGARNTALLAVVLLAGSELLASFSVKNVGGLFFTSGALMGVGVW